MAGHKPSEKKRKKMMYGKRVKAGSGMYMKKRKGMYIGGNVMEVAKPN